MIANTPSLKKDSKDSKNSYEQDKQIIFTICKQRISELCGDALGKSDSDLFSRYGKLLANTKPISNAIAIAINQAITDGTYNIDSISIDNVTIAINYELTANKEEQEEILTGSRSAPSLYFSRSNSPISTTPRSPTPRSPTPKGMFRTLSGIGSCFGGSQRSSTSTSPADFNLNGSPSPKP